MVEAGSTVLSHLPPSQVVMEPYPHVIRESVFESQYYQDLSQSFPSAEAILRGRVDPMGNAAARMPFQHVINDGSIAEIWRDFFKLHCSSQFWLEIVRVFGDQLRDTFPALERKIGRRMEDWRVTPRGIKGDFDVRLDCQFVINTPSQQASSVKTPHVDMPSTIFSGLFYMRLDDDDTKGGELDLYRWRREPRFFGARLTLPEDVEYVTTAHYRANSFLGFINSPRSVHGVSPRNPSPVPRRYVNLIARVFFDACTLPRVSYFTRILKFREMRRQQMRSLGGDRY